MFKSGDIVKLCKSELDIELIPEGTEIVLTKPNGLHLWYGNAVLNGKERIVLVLADNLESVK